MLTVEASFWGLRQVVHNEHDNGHSCAISRDTRDWSY